jgi:hypothetical protein
MTFSVLVVELSSGIENKVFGVGVSGPLISNKDSAEDDSTDIADFLKSALIVLPSLSDSE